MTDTQEPRTSVRTGYKLRDDFEAWVRNPHILNRKTEPGYTDDYEHPWARGAWAAWKECHERAKPVAARDSPQITREQWEDACRGLGTKG